MEFFEIRNKKNLLAKYGNDWSKLKEMIDTLPQDVIDYVPDIKDAWSIREHVAHLMDVEIRAFIRYRNAVADPGAALNLGGWGRGRKQYLTSLLFARHWRFFGDHKASEKRNPKTCFAHDRRGDDEVRDSTSRFWPNQSQDDPFHLHTTR